MIETAKKYLNQAPLLNRGLLSVIDRGSAEILRAEERGVLLHDTVSGIYFLSAVCGAETLSWLEEVEDASMFVVTDPRFIPHIQQCFALERQVELWQFVYEESDPPVYEHNLSIANPTDAEMAIIEENYHEIGLEELRHIRARKELFAAHTCSGEMAGFIGIHLEGCIGLLNIFPDFRRFGYATELEATIIALELERGHVPFCQVYTDNDKSLNLQLKLGYTQSPGNVFYIW